MAAEATKPAVGNEDETTTTSITSKPTTQQKPPRRAPASHRIHELSSHSTNYSATSLLLSRPTQNNKPSVRFDESTLVAPTKKYPRQDDPRKIYMGKLSRTQACLYFSIPVVVVAIMLFLTADFESNRQQQANSKSVKASFADILQQKAKDALSRRRIDPCALFLHSGSIPNTGWSYFAGQDYQKGDLILEINSPSQLLTLTTGDDDDDNSGLGEIRVPPYALVLKHHPTLANAGGTLYYYLPSSKENKPVTLLPLRATRYIEAGQEIFVSYDPVLHRHSPTFDHIPTMSDYQIADGIIADMLTTSRRAASSRKASAKPNSAVSFPLVKRAVAQFNPRVAALLPDKMPLEAYDTKVSSALARLHNRTLVSLQNAPAVCVGDIVPLLHPTSDSHGSTTTSTTKWTTRNNVKKGSVVVTVPVHMQPMETNACAAATPENELSDDPPQECRSALLSPPSNCFGDATLPVRFCPLTHVSFPRPDNKNETTTHESIHCNVEYQWKERKMQRLSLPELLVGASHDLAWNLVALEDLTAGQELRMNTIPWQNHYKIPNSVLVSSAWKQDPLSIATS